MRNLTVSFPQKVVAMMGHLSAKSGCRECFIDSCVIIQVGKYMCNFYISVHISIVCFKKNLRLPGALPFPFTIMRVSHKTPRLYALTMDPAAEVTMTCIP